MEEESRGKRRKWRNLVVHLTNLVYICEIRAVEMELVGYHELKC